MFSDWQIFWHQHQERPPLATSITFGEGYTERLGDDGEIIEVHYDNTEMAKIMRDAVKEISSMKLSPFWFATQDDQ